MSINVMQVRPLLVHALSMAPGLRAVQCVVQVGLHGWLATHIRAGLDHCLLLVHLGVCVGGGVWGRWWGAGGAMMGR